MTKFEVVAAQDSNYLPFVVLINKTHVRKQIKLNNVFRKCSGDRVNEDNLLQILR